MPKLKTIASKIKTAKAYSVKKFSTENELYLDADMGGKIGKNLVSNTTLSAHLRYREEKNGSVVTRVVGPISLSGIIPDN